MQAPAMTPLPRNRAGEARNADDDLFTNWILSGMVAGSKMNLPSRAIHDQFNE